MGQALLLIGSSSEGHSCEPAASKPSIWGRGCGPCRGSGWAPRGPCTPAFSSTETAQCWRRGGSELGTGSCPNRVTIFELFPLSELLIPPLRSRRELQNPLPGHAHSSSSMGIWTCEPLVKCCKPSGVTAHVADLSTRQGRRVLGCSSLSSEPWF